MTNSRRRRPARAALALALCALAAAALAPVAHAPAPVAVGPPAIAPLDAVPRLMEIENPQAGMRAFLARRSGPGPGGHGLAYLAARRQAGTMLGRVLPQVAPGAFERDWTPLGPSNLGGRIRALVVDPKDPNVLYTGGVAGGVWKSTDGAATWTHLTETLSNVGVSSIAIDPANSKVVYVGTGEHLANRPNFKPFSGVGVMKSTDAGETWRLLPGTVGNPEFNVVHDIVVSSSDSRVLYAGVSAGVARSTDAGATWQVVHRARSVSGCGDLAIRTDRTPDVLLANCADDGPDGVYRSEDGGGTWTQVINVVNGEEAGYTAVAFAPSNQDVAYASVARVQGSPGGSNGALALLRSNDGGVSWASQNDGGYTSPGSPSWLSSCPSKDGQGVYDNVIAVDPTNPERIWVGGVDMYRSDDGGKTLAIAGYWWLDQVFADASGRPVGDGTPMIHADHHAIAFPPNYDGAANQTIYFGNDGGVFRTQNALAPLPNLECNNQTLAAGGIDALNDVVYDSMNEGLSIFQFWAGTVSADGTVVMGGAQDNGVWIRPEGANESGWIYAMGGDGFSTAIRPDKTRYYGTRQFLDIGRSSTGGILSFFPITRGIDDEYEPFNTLLLMDPNNPDILWTAGSKMWRTRDAGDLWVAASTRLGYISAFTIAPSDSAVMYVGDELGAIHTSTNATSETPSWQSVDVVEATKPGDSPVTGLAADPSDPRVAYATIGGFTGPRVMKTTDGGATWTDISGNLPAIPAQTVAVNPLNPNMVFVGTDAGLYESPNGGTTWLPANGDLTSTIVQHLLFRPGSSELYMFTFGRGAYRTDVGTGG